MKETIILFTKKVKQQPILFYLNRPLEILSIHSELMCSNDAIQEYRTLAKLPSRIQYLRHDKLLKLAQLLKHKTTRDKKYFRRARN